MPCTTTVMVKNIPTKFTCKSLTEILNTKGFNSETYDFMYLPMDFRTRKNCGYCFINFVTSDECNRFVATFQGMQLKADTSAKCLDIVESKRQGFNENVSVFSDLFLTSKFKNPLFKPLVKVNGDNIPLDEDVFTVLLHKNNSGPLSVLTS